MSTQDLTALRAQLIAERQGMRDRLERAVELQSVLRVWLVGRKERLIGGYWPIKGEFDPLPALYRWGEADDARRIGLPVSDRTAGTLSFHVWYPGCPMELDAHDIAKPAATEAFHPELLVLPCVGFGPGGVRLGYGGGFFGRAIASMRPAPFTVGLCYSNGFVPTLGLDDGDVKLNAILTEDGVQWQRWD